MKTKKNANDVHLQCQRIVAFLYLYLHCISVGKIRQCIDASSVRLWPTRKMRLYPPHSRPLPPPCHGLIASNYPVGSTLHRRSLRPQLRRAVVCFWRSMLTSDKLTSSGFSVFVSYWHRDAIIEWTSYSKCALVCVYLKILDLCFFHLTLFHVCLSYVH